MPATINLFALSSSDSVLEGIDNLLREKQEINLVGNSKDFKPTLYYFNSSISSRRNSVIFIDDNSIEKKKIVNYLQTPHTMHSAKTLIYTDSINNKYLNRLWVSNVNGILHNRETPLRDFFKQYKEEKESVSKSRRVYLKIERKFIDTIKLVGSGCNCYDGLVSSLILGRYLWAKEANLIDSIKDLSKETEEKEKLNEKNSSEQFNNEAEKIKLLTEREEEILLRIAEGKTNFEIAEELFISAGTVEQHKAHIIRKLGIRNTHELFIFAYKNKNIL